MAPELSHLLQITPPNTPTESSEPVAHSAHPARSAQASGPGKEPGLREAFSFINQVKVQFVDQAETFKTFIQVLKDYKSQEINTRGMANRILKLFAEHPNLIQGFNVFITPGYEIECDTSNDPKAIHASSHPVARNSLTPTQIAQVSGTNNVAPQQPGATKGKAVAAKDAELFKLSTMMRPCNPTLPIPQRLTISIQPPSLTRPEIELYPPILVRLLPPRTCQTSGPLRRC